ncbi:MAG: hypothetical protein M0Z94_10050 [Dehalococcoidales bacterium]|nr:hypothetical protein [Dehalococcoidales bacterium]
MDSTNEKRDNSIWVLLGSIGALLALVAAIPTIKAAQQRRETDIAARPCNLSSSMPDIIKRQMTRQAQKTTSQSISAGLRSAWDSAMGGMRTQRRARRGVTSAVQGSIMSTGSSLGQATGHVASSVTGFVLSTLWRLGWLAVASAVLMLVYLPDPKQRERFLGTARKYYDQARGTVSNVGQSVSQNLSQQAANAEQNLKNQG